MRRVGVINMTWAAVAVGVIAIVVVPAGAAEIRAAVQGEHVIRRVWAVQRSETDVGVYDTATIAGKAGDGVLVVEGITKPGRYDIRIETDRGDVWGWDASFPPDDYEEPQPLTEESKRIIFEKLASQFATGFDDHAVVLDIQGNSQHATALINQRRVRPFTGGGYKPGEQVWRVTRWEFECPEDTWVPRVGRPYAAMFRHRLSVGEYDGRRMVFSRALGGIRIAATEDVVDLGTIVLPSINQGVAAVHPDGTPTAPVTLKPR